MGKLLRYELPENINSIVLFSEGRLHKKTAHAALYKQ